MNTPASRIAENPLIFQSLPQDQQALVRRGQICEGMGTDAVFLAWGAPNSRPYVGQQKGKNIVRWVYNVSEPVIVDGAYGPRGWYNPYYGVYDPFYYTGPDVVYVPRNAATVLFENGKVVSWEARSAR